MKLESRLKNPVRPAFPNSPVETFGHVSRHVAVRDLGNPDRVVASDKPDLVSAALLRGGAKFRRDRVGIDDPVGARLTSEAGVACAETLCRFRPRTSEAAAPSRGDRVICCVIIATAAINLIVVAFQFDMDQIPAIPARCLWMSSENFSLAIVYGVYHEELSCRVVAGLGDGTCRGRNVSTGC